MSMTAIRPYFRKRLTALGYKEWIDPFGQQQIPANLLDKSFHQSITQVFGVDKSNTAQSMDATVRIQIALKGFKEPEKALDSAISKSEAAIADLINPANFADTSPHITGVFLNSINFDPFDDKENDNVILAVMLFTVRIYVCVE